jgi:hypothetical protein
MTKFETPAPSREELRSREPDARYYGISPEGVRPYWETYAGRHCPRMHRFGHNLHVRHRLECHGAARVAAGIAELLA